MRFVLATWNVNSIRARLDGLLPWLTEVAPDVLCLQETKVQDDGFPIAEIEDAGYRSAFRGEKAYNGVAILSRHPIDDVRCGFDDEGPSDEARLLVARIQGLHVVNAYVPQGRSLDHPMFAYKLQWFDRLRAFLDRHFSPTDPLIWTGDLNVAPTPIDVWWGQTKREEHVCFHPRVTDAMDRVMAWGFVDVFRAHHPEPEQFTYFDYRQKDGVLSGRGWRIDHILATEALARRSHDAWIDLVPRRGERPSDHAPLLASFDLGECQATSA